MKKLWTAAAWLVVAAGSAAWAADLSVGPGRRFDRPEAALAAAKSGDVIRIYPPAGQAAYERVALAVDTPKITLRGMGDRPVALRGQGFDYSGRGRTPRAIVQFNRGADGCSLENFELSGARNESCNGAGVRINQANGVSVRQCVIHDNDMGIMSNGQGEADGESAARDQLIEDCRIYANGTARQAGYNHNLYLGGASVTLRGCEIYGSVTGHNLKSRARLTRVLGCYIHDSANRELDLVDAKGWTDAPGADAVVAGCVIVKAAKCAGNRAVIHFGQDGGGQRDGVLWLAHNTIITPFFSAVVTLSSSQSRTQLINNLIVDPTGAARSQTLVELAGAAADAAGGRGNWVTAGFAASDQPPAAGGRRGGARSVAPPASLGLAHVAAVQQRPEFVDPAHGDYRVNAAWAGAGAAWPAELTNLLAGALLEFRSPLGSQPRPDAAAEKPAVGAHAAATAGR